MLGRPLRCKVAVVTEARQRTQMRRLSGSSRLHVWLAWALLASCVALMALALLLMYLNGAHRILERLLYPPVFLAFATVGALVASRRPHNPIGWIFCAVGITNVLWALALEYTLYAFVLHPGPLAGKELAAWLVTGWISSLGWGLMLTFVPLLFPTGRLLSARWRLAAYLAALACALQVVGVAFQPGPVDRSLPGVQNPLGLVGAAGPFALLDRAGSVLVLVTVLVCVGSLILRLLRSRGEERLQIKWFVYAVVVLMVLVLISAITGDFGPASLWAVVFALGVVGIPTAAGVAILRYRLYEIDLIINRTLVYGSLSAALAGLYFGAIVVLQRLFVLLTGEKSTLAVVASTLLIAALFNPLRRRIQSFIDRRFYRRKYDAAKTLEAFSARLREETDLGALTDNLVGVVGETMQPSHVSLWLRPETAPQHPHED